MPKVLTTINDNPEYRVFCAEVEAFAKHAEEEIQFLTKRIEQVLDRQRINAKLVWDKLEAALAAKGLLEGLNYVRDKTPLVCSIKDNAIYFYTEQEWEEHINPLKGLMGIIGRSK